MLSRLSYTSWATHALQVSAPPPLPTPSPPRPPPPAPPHFYKFKSFLATMKSCLNWQRFPIRISLWLPFQVWRQRHLWSRFKFILLVIINRLLELVSLCPKVIKQRLKQNIKRFSLLAPMRPLRFKLVLPIFFFIVRIICNNLSSFKISGSLGLEEDVPKSPHGNINF